uniref:MD-2-related lipid-recognition domain-containing protein n=1 Tax=Anopheles epiroticus TaxID=199890 RepID=A0A182PSN9_9DIPT
MVVSFGGTKYHVLSIDLSSCATAPCTMHRGTNVTVRAEFSADGSSTDSVLKHETYFILNSVKTKAVITPTTCEGSVCPLQGTKGLLFSANVYVNADLPPINGKLRWELRNNQGDVLLCYQLPVCIVKSTTARSQHLRYEFNMQLAAVVSLSVLLSGVFADVVTIQQCTEGSLPSAVDVTGCQSTPCELPKGKDAAVLVDFTADRELTALVPKVQASFGGMTVPFELPDDRKDACQWLVGGMCPVSRDEDVTYELQLPVLAVYPTLSLTVELRLVDQNNQIVTCFQLQAKVV